MVHVSAPPFSCRDHPALCPLVLQIQDQLAEMMQERGVVIGVLSTSCCWTAGTRAAHLLPKQCGDHNAQLATIFHHHGQMSFLSWGDRATQAREANSKRHKASNSKHLNNIIEADHGALKQVIRPARGFQTMKPATVTTKGLRDHAHDPARTLPRRQTRCAQ